MKTIRAWVVVLPLLLAAMAWSEEEPSARITADLRDGSRLIGTLRGDELHIKTELGKLKLPVRLIREVQFQRDKRLAVVSFLNGDRLTGKLLVDELELDGLLGQLNLPVGQLDKLSIILCGGPLLPGGEGPIEFGGVKWTAWRIQAEVQGDRLVTLPKARPGFDYGHSGHGRHATVVTNVGSDDWKNYQLECEVGVGRVNPSFNPYGLPPLFEQRSVAILFHVADMKESWNETGVSAYTLMLGANGKWSLDCCYNRHVPLPRGHIDEVAEASRSIASGEGIKLDEEKGNRVRIRVAGDRIEVWLDDEKLVDAHDPKMRDEIGGQRLDHGGVAFQWTLECMGWVRNFSVHRL